MIALPTLCCTFCHAAITLTDIYVAAKAHEAIEDFGNSLDLKTGFRNSSDPKTDFGNSFDPIKDFGNSSDPMTDFGNAT